MLRGAGGDSEGPLARSAHIPSVTTSNRLRHCVQRASPAANRPQLPLRGIVAFAAAVVGCCGLAGSCRRESSQALDVVVCLVDALRADRLSCYGAPRPTSPEIDALAREGVLFERAHAAAPWTLPSIATLFTGAMPSTHGAGAWQEVRGEGNPTSLDEALPTLAERVRSHGYRAFARGANPYLELGCLRGFERASVLPGTARNLVDWAIEAAEGAGDRPLFLYLHFMDVHTSRDVPEDFIAKYPTPEAGPRGPEHLTFSAALDAPLHGAELARFATHRLAVYDGAVSYVDQEIGRLRRSLRAARGRPALWIVAADHGEEMWEHEAVERESYPAAAGHHGAGHGQALFEELLRVPWIVAGPGVARGARIRTPVSLADFASTLLDFLGISPHAAPGGRSLRPSLAAGTEPARIPILAEQILYGREKRSLLRADDTKLIFAIGGGERSLAFDLAADPGEATDMLRSWGDTGAFAARGELNAAFEGLPRRGAFAESALDEATLGQLRNVGYLGGAGSRPSSRAAR